MDLLHFDNTRDITRITQEELEHIVSHSHFFSGRLVEKAITELQHRQETEKERNYINELEREGNRITETELRNCM